MSDNTTPSRGPTESEAPRQLSDDMRSLVETWRHESNKTARGEGQRDKQVTPDACAILRMMAEEYDTKRAISDRLAWITYEQVRYHVNGDCACDESNHVHEDECYRMRMYAQRGAPADTLAMLNGLEVKTVYKHISGRCSHPDGMPPVDTSRGAAPSTAPADD